jgi:hypothetical protein
MEINSKLSNSERDCYKPKNIGVEGVLLQSINFIPEQNAIILLLTFLNSDYNLRWKQGRDEGRINIQVKCYRKHYLSSLIL